MSDNIMQLSGFTTLGVGGEGKVRFLTQASEAEEAIAHAALVLGKGSNVLISDRGINGITVINRLCSVTVDGEVIVAQGGLSLASLSAIATSRGLSGVEALGGIPGSVGGAVRMNASAFGKSVSDVIEYTDIIRDGKRMRLDKTALQLGYRNANGLKEKDFVLSAAFRLTRSSVSEIKAETRRLYLRRREIQPQGKSAGSTYLNAEKPAGWYIDRAGLKGMRVGGAFVSEKHANFIVNDGDATADDVLTLMKRIEATVYDKFGIELKREIKLVGEF